MISNKTIQSVDEVVVENESPLSCSQLENCGFVVVMYLMRTKDMNIIVANGEGPFPSLPPPSETTSLSYGQVDKEQQKGLWYFLFGNSRDNSKKPEKKHALFVRDLRLDECHGVESRRVEMRRLYSKFEIVLQIVRGVEYVLLPRNWYDISCWRERLGNDIFGLSLRNRKFPVFETSIRYGNAYLTDYGTKFGIPEIEQNVIFNYSKCTNEQRVKMVEKVYEIDFKNVEIHPLYFIFAFTEFGKSLRYFKLLKKFGKSPSPYLETILSSNSLKFISKYDLDIIRHFKFWLHVPINVWYFETTDFSDSIKVGEYDSTPIRRIDWLKERLLSDDLQTPFEIEHSDGIDISFGKAGDEIVQRMNLAVIEKCYYKQEYLSCRLVELDDGNSHANQDVYPIFWREDTFVIHSENLQLLCENLLNIVSMIVKNWDLTVEEDVPFLDYDLVDMRYLYRIELSLKQSKIISSKLSQHLDSFNLTPKQLESANCVVKTITSQIRNVEMMAMSLLQLSNQYEKDLFVKIPHRFQAIIMLSEWIDHCLDFTHSIQGYFLQYFNFPNQIDKYFSDIVIEKLIMKQIKTQDIYEMAKYLSIMSTAIQHDLFLYHAGWIIDAFSAWIEK
ncbi:predicted protein [Naegleria gruberi]|uniref:Predicted protein n=1 Tax=Naegleria gruberi TaxID=5762 RepID=D2VVM3_NAEGR|nr:uncharacterized protein NAEGRDRAFT_52616 [Naegleria gruberi]EFC39066.1 predicted protein [Naegleria gruberi]|eukprot:XP_002671810.1 predicted protein [Naegleria gruberi strain NEG-M]